MALDKLVDSTQLDADLTSVANAIRTKSGGSSQLAFPTGFVSEIGAIPSGGGETVYVSSTGLLYTAVMTIDLSMDRTNGYTIKDVLTRYGDMPNLEDLTLTGIMRNGSTNAAEITAASFSATHYPLLSKLKIQPTDIRNSSGTAYSETADYYNKLKFSHYAFSGTNLTELVLGKVGGPYFVGGGYYRSDLPQPPGTSAYQVGSEDGLTLKIYVESYLSPAAGFSSSLAPNTTVIQYDYLTGEVLTA